MSAKQSMHRSAPVLKNTMENQNQANEAMNTGDQITGRAGLAHVLQAKLGNRATMQMFTSQASSLPSGIGGTLHRQTSIQRNGSGSVPASSPSTNQTASNTIGNTVSLPSSNPTPPVPIPNPVQAPTPNRLAGIKQSLIGTTRGTIDAPVTDTMNSANKYMDPTGKIADKTTGAIGKSPTGLSTEMGIANSSAGMVSSTFSGLLAFKNLLKARSENNSAGVAENSLGLVESAINVTSSTSGLVKDSSIAAGHADGIGASKAASDWSSGVGEMFQVITNGYKTIMKIYELYKSSGGISSGKKFKDSFSTIASGLETASAVIKSVKSVLDILEKGTGGLGSAIPGLGIAISGATLTVKVYDLIKSGISSYQMRSIKRSFKEQYNRTNSSDNYVKQNSYLGGRVKGNLGVDKNKFEARQSDIPNQVTQAEADAQLAAAKAQEAEDNANQATNDTDKENFNKEKAKYEKDKQKAEAAKASLLEELRRMDEYTLAKEMKNINVKRVDRALLHVGLELTNMAGDITTLTGVGAHVGVGLKAAAAGGKAAMPLIRSIKQAGRNRATETNAWGAIFDHTKSSEKKHQKRVKDTDLLLDMIEKLPEPSEANAQDRYRTVELFISATGCSLEELYARNGIDEKRKLIMSAMAVRETE